MLGIFVITSGGIKSVTPVGIMLMALTGASWGMHCVWGKKFEDAFAYTYGSFLVFGLIAAFLFFLAYFIWNDGLGITSFSVLGWVLFMGIISTALSYALWHRVVKKITASQAGISQLLVPVLTVLMGVLFLKEELTFSLLYGGVLILLGIFLNNLKMKKR